MPKLKNQFPKMCRDRNQAFSKHNGKRIYHGVWGSPEAEKSYRRFIAALTEDRVLSIRTGGDAKRAELNASKVGEFYDKNSYRKAIQYAIQKGNRHQLCVSEVGDADGWKEVQEEFESNIKASLHLLPESRDRRQLINHLYEKFFVGISNTVGLELQTENGVVYTPLEVADFMVRSADKLLRDELGTDGIGGQKVTVFDPFTGSGTFLGRMLYHVAQSDPFNKLRPVTLYLRSIVQVNLQRCNVRISSLVITPPMF